MSHAKSTATRTLIKNTLVKHPVSPHLSAINRIHFPDMYKCYCILEN